MNKILIVTSEPLNENDILSSTFELTQAKILSQYYSVAILSVYIDQPIFTRLKACIIGPYLKGSVRNRYSDLFASIVDLFRNTTSRHYCIEGISVCEGRFSAIRAVPDFQQALDIWVRAGIYAFQDISKDHGLPDIIHAHGRFLNAGALALKIKEKYNIPFIYTEHSTYYQRGLAPGDAKSILAQIVKQSNRFIAVSKSLLESVSTFLHEKIANALVLPNVLDTIFEQPLPVKEKRKEIRFITVAALEHKKGIDVLLSAFSVAFSGIDEVSLTILGDGPLKDELILQRDALDLKGKVVLKGRKTKFEILEELDASDVFVLPSRVETFGVVVIEALSRGLPVIATRSGGPEFIVNDKCGLVVEPDNNSQLVSALQQMRIQVDGFDAQSIRNYALNSFGSKPFLESMKKIYNDSINGLYN